MFQVIDRLLQTVHVVGDRQITTEVNVVGDRQIAAEAVHVVPLGKGEETEKPAQANTQG